MSVHDLYADTHGTMRSSDSCDEWCAALSVDGRLPLPLFCLCCCSLTDSWPVGRWTTAPPLCLQRCVRMHCTRCPWRRRRLGARGRGGDLADGWTGGRCVQTNRKRKRKRKRKRRAPVGCRWRSQTLKTPNKNRPDSNQSAQHIHESSISSTHSCCCSNCNRAASAVRQAVPNKRGSRCQCALSPLLLCSAVRLPAAIPTDDQSNKQIAHHNNTQIHTLQWQNNQQQQQREADEAAAAAAVAVAVVVEGAHLPLHLPPMPILRLVHPPPLLPSPRAVVAAAASA